MKLKFRNDVKIGLREKLIILCPAVVLAILAFLIAFYFVDPLPPRRLSIGCGPPEGANFIYAQAYREILVKNFSLIYMQEPGSNSQGGSNL
jgi:hypothetical protein